MRGCMKLAEILFKKINKHILTKKATWLKPGDIVKLLCKSSCHCSFCATIKVGDCLKHSGTSSINHVLVQKNNENNGMYNFPSLCFEKVDN